MIAQETVHHPVERTHLPENLEPTVDRKLVDDDGLFKVHTSDCLGWYSFAEQVVMFLHMDVVQRNPHKATVLVVDDSVEMQRYLRILLELDSYRVEAASNGREALQRLRLGCAPQVMLLDMQMPGMDGLETLRQLQQFRPRPRVIMCSAVDDPGKIAETAALGACAYLTKPIQHLYLSAAIERCLNQTPPSQRLEHLASRPFILPSPRPL